MKKKSRTGLQLQKQIKIRNFAFKLRVMILMLNWISDWLTKWATELLPDWQTEQLSNWLGDWLNQAMYTD